MFGKTPRRLRVKRIISINIERKKCLSAIFVGAGEAGAIASQAPKFLAISEFFGYR